MMKFNVMCKTRLYVDHGPTGVSSTIAQQYKEKQGNIVYCPIHYNSRVITETERHYEKVQSESLAVLFGIKSNRMYL